jgi:hypothetical protein
LEESRVNKMMNEEVYKKIVSKKEFSDLPREDVEKVYFLIDKKDLILEEKVKKTRDLLRKVYFAFGSLKLLNSSIINKKNAEEILKKHISTLERRDFFKEVYSRIFLEQKNTKISIFDLGAGINGLSYPVFKEIFSKDKFPEYFALEAVGQLVVLMNLFFKKNSLKKASAFRKSLFDLDFVEKFIKEKKGKKIVFLFKVVDSLESLERNYSKKLLERIVPLVEKVVVSFATRSLVSKKRFKIKRYWFENFLLKKGWKILDSFELGGEKYVCFSGGND